MFCDFLVYFYYTLCLHDVCRYQNELPKKIKSRGKDAHLIHEELVQLMKWKQTVSDFTLVQYVQPVIVFYRLNI